MMQKILIVEDDADIAANVAEFLSRSDPMFAPVICRNGFDAAAAALKDPAIALMVLDVGLPGCDGLTVCEKLRAAGWQQPVIMLTARDTERDRISGLECGADDYVCKPFSLGELLARIRAQLRRVQRDTAGRVLQVADLRLNTGTMHAERAGVALELNGRLLKILEVLMRKSPEVVRREELIAAVWLTPPSPETVRTHIYMLRNRIDKPFEKPLLRTYPTLGWALREPEAQ